MKINEVAVGEIIQVRVSKGEKKFECIAQVVASRDDGIIVTLMKFGGQVIDFAGEGLQILAFYVSDNNQPIGWSGIRIKKDVFQGKYCHIIFSKKESVRVNRRSMQRIRTEMNATVRVKSSQYDVEAIIRNYSLGGIGFTSKTDIMELDFLPANIVYEDGAKHFKVVHRVQIMRKELYDRNTYMYGARILNPSEEWEDYVQAKLIELSKKAQMAGNQ